MQRLGARLMDRRLALLLMALLLLGAGLSACDRAQSPMRPDDAGPSEMSVLIPLSKPAAANISRAEIVITADGMVDMQRDLTVSGTAITGNVTSIPAGPDRLFTINGFSSANVLTYSGSARADVVAGQSVRVAILVRPTGGATGAPTLVISSTATARRPTYEGNTTITGEIQNSGNAAGTGVSLQLRARNSEGSAISDASVTIGTLAEGRSSLFTASFSGTCYAGGTYTPCRATFVASVDYTLSYNEGEAITGSISVQ